MPRSRLLALAIAAVVSAVPARAATFDFSLLNGSSPVGSGTFSFQDALRGGTVRASQLTDFSITLGGESFGLDALSYLTYNSVTDLFQPTFISPSIGYLIRGKPNPATFRGLFDVAGLYDYLGSGRLTAYEYTTGGGPVYFTSLTISAVPEPAAWALLGISLLGIALVHRTGAKRPG